MAFLLSDDVYLRTWLIKELYMNILKIVRMKLKSAVSYCRDFIYSKAVVVSAASLGLVSASSFAADASTSYTPAFISTETLQPIASAIIAVIGIVGGVVIGVLATSISAKVAISLVKSFFSRAGG